MIRARLTRHAALVVGLGLLAAVLATYAASLGNAPVWDDRPLVVDNPFLGSLAGLGRLWTTDLWTASAQGEPSSYYRPFTMFTFWVNVALGGRSAASLRLGNVLIHAANAMLLASFARKALGIGWRAAGLVALLFAVAPVCSEPVLWISGRFDLLVVTFALLALLAARKEGRGGLALGLAAVAGGLLCKESFIGWLPLLFFDDVFVRRVRGRQLVAKYVAITAIAAAYLVLRKIIGIPSLETVTNTGVRALAESFAFLVATFLRELVWPTTLDPFRPYIVPSAATLLVTVALVAGLVGAPLARFRRDRENATTRFVLFGVTWFLFATVPSAVVGPTLAMIGDRYAYLPLVGLFLASMPLAGELEARDAQLGWRAASALGSALAVAWAIATGVHARDWRDDASLAASSLASDPENPYALYWLGTDAAQHGELAKADDLLTRSIARNPGSWRTWNAVCYLRLQESRLAEAERACKQTIGLNERNPRGWLNLASVYVRSDRWSDALASADRALALKPGFAEAHYLAGVSAANLGSFPLAKAHVDAGLRSAPSHPRLLALQGELARHLREPPPSP
jgi:hypothetical protein